jgi:hypothetical protein
MRRTTPCEKNINNRGKKNWGKNNNNKKKRNTNKEIIIIMGE